MCVCVCVCMGLDEFASLCVYVCACVHVAFCFGNGRVIDVSVICCLLTSFCIPICTWLHYYIIYI